jgi:hypothetical protein
MTDYELLKQSLDALEYASDETKPVNLHGCDCLLCTTILALRDRLAQPETPDVTPEVTPYVIDCPRCGHCCPQRQWVGLTDDEIGMPTEPIQPNEATMFARVIEALLKGKNT